MTVAFFHVHYDINMKIRYYLVATYQAIKIIYHYSEYTR